MHDIFITRSRKLPWQASRRQGLQEKRLLTFETSTHQNLVLLRIDQDTVVDAHIIENSESILVLKGKVRVTDVDGAGILEPGDLCHFQPGSTHGLVCLEGPSEFLAIFAPGLKRSPASSS